MTVREYSERMWRRSLTFEWIKNSVSWRLRSRTELFYYCSAIFSWIYFPFCNCVEASLITVPKPVDISTYQRWPTVYYSVWFCGKVDLDRREEIVKLRNCVVRTKPAGTTTKRFGTRVRRRIKYTWSVQRLKRNYTDSVYAKEKRDWRRFE